MNTIKKLALTPKTKDSADPISSAILEKTQSGMGMIPNIYATMANNPALLESYTSAYASFRQNSGFTPQEQEVVFLSISYENECGYCMAAHSIVADYMTKVPTEVTDAIRNNTEIPDAKLWALSLFTKVMISERGNPSQQDIDDFLYAGYTEEHILGVIAGIGVKIMSNYFNHVFDTPVDDAFKERIWTKP